MSRPFEASAVGGCILVFLLVGGGVQAQTDQAIYTDSLQNSWEAWGWTQINYNNTSPVRSGSKSISVTITNNTYQAIYLHHAAFDTGGFTNLTFWIHGGTSGGQRLQVQALLGNTAQPAVALPNLTANSWEQITLSLASLGVANQPNFTGFWIQDRIGAAQPTFYLDDITLVANTSSPPTNAPLAITVNALQNRRPISPFIYGVAFATPAELTELNATLNRSGGNSETRYNWQLNAHNRAADWYFESLADSPATAGAAADTHVSDSKNGGAEPMLTVPMIGWMPKLGANRARLSSYSIAKYGPQTGNDWQWFPDAGNGVGTNSTAKTSWLITTNNPNDANFPTNSAFQREWIKHLTNRWGLSASGGVRYYCMDNEHTLWHSTHRDAHPVGTTMQEIRDKFFDYGEMVKDLDPGALLVFPEEWGWPGYLYSGYDWQWAGDHRDWNPAHFPDRATNGGWDYLPWLLDQARQCHEQTGRRLLDVLSVHIYPQGGESGSDTSTSIQLLRNRSTRALWDTNYVDESWIANKIMLIPRLRNWVATHYPGTKIGITEYNWGAENHINGATAQADLLGIFGREGLEYATRWTTPSSSTPTFKAMKLFRNYDGNQSGFGDISVAATGPNPDTLACFAAERSTDGALTILAINKQLATAAPVNITLTNFLPRGTAQVWQLTSANTITRQTDLSFTGNAFSNSLPAQSITLFVLPAGSPPWLAAAAISTSNTFEFWLSGPAGQRYAIQESSNLANWVTVQTHTLSSPPLRVVLPATAGNRFYRAQWMP